MSEQVIVEKDMLMQAQGFWEKNQRSILIALFAIVVIVGGVFAYNKFIKEPN